MALGVSSLSKSGFIYRSSGIINIINMNDFLRNSGYFFPLTPHAVELPNIMIISAWVFGPIKNMQVKAGKKETIENIPNKNPAF
ncbi:MAG: hypothetical protein K6U80_10615 [Firmicutes bacterium]|nr:hypothetical protein [Bacillota bacterium]